ncbi:MAG: hypothetical protein CMI02_02890 [Oceanospirillaceae bacterium]|nr:hypothetical protein [Oceanospirillaceae bacterium]MBT10965.1 hypothetical protein [Oceanospirillaceae bacterium]|tara:strand:- start:70868 stop:71650 length:783 start_codon:yes stop_codon:yes gene_type:complete
MNVLKKTLLSASLMLPLMTNAETISDAEAEYLSGSLCTLSQRMAKDYIAIGADIRPDKAQKDLDETIALFEQRFQMLMEYAETHRMKKEFQIMADSWLKYRTDVLGKPEREAAKILIKDSEALLDACNKVVAAITSQSGSAIAPLIELSEQETTLAQKIARDYFALYWHVDDDNLKQDFEQSVQDFDQNLQKLIKANQNTAEIKTLLSKVESQWKFSNSGFQLDESGRYVPTVISVTTDSIYKKMEDIAIQYENLMAASR